MGDRLAPVMAAGCLLTLPAIAGLHAIAIARARRPRACSRTSATALCAALSNGFTGFALWRRDRHEWRTRREDTACPCGFDPVTKLSQRQSAWCAN